MKIFYDGVIFLYQWQGGVNRIFEEIIARLSRIDNNVEMYLHRFPDSFKRSFMKREYFLAPKIGRIFREVDNFIMSAEIKSYKPDIYHSTYYRIFKSNKIKNVITVYDMIHERYPRYFLKAAYHLRQKRHSIETADRIIAISENTRQDILNYYHVVEDKINVTHLAASHNFYPAQKEEKNRFCKEYNLVRPYILYVGQRRGYKNFLLLLKTFSVWKKNRDIDLICIGGDRNWEREESVIIRKTSLVSSVKHFSCVNDSQLRLFYAASLVFVFPSLYEGFGIPILEAMACASPVILAKSASMPEVAGDAGMYFDPNSIENLLYSLNKLSEDEDLRTELIRKGLNRNKQFSWSKTTKATYDIYQYLMQNR